MIKAVGLIVFVHLGLLVGTFATPGEELLKTKLPEDQRDAIHVAEAPLIEAVKEALKDDRSLASQITAAAEHRAIDCSTAEQVLRTVLRDLVPRPTAREFLAISRAALHTAPADEQTALNRYGQKVLSRNCSESLLVTATAEYPGLAWVLSEAGKQVDGKQVDGKQVEGKQVEGKQIAPAEQTETPPAQPMLGELLDPSLLPPAVVDPGSSGGLVQPTTP